MDAGDKVRLWKPQPGVPLKAVGTVLRAEDEWDDHQGDIYITHVEVDFGEYGVHHVTDSDVAVLGDWRDKMFMEAVQEGEREAEREALAQQIEETLAILRKSSGK